MNHTYRIKTVSVIQQHIISRQSWGISGVVGRFNVGLAILALAFLLGYVVQTNLLAAKTWQMRHAQDKLTLILEQRNTLIAQQSELDDRTVLQDLAIRQGFVPVGTVVYLVQDTAVAAIR